MLRDFIPVQGAYLLSKAKGTDAPKPVRSAGKCQPKTDADFVKAVP